MLKVLIIRDGDGRLVAIAELQPHVIGPSANAGERHVKVGSTAGLLGSPSDWGNGLLSLLRSFVLYPAVGMSAAASLLLPIWGTNVPESVKEFAIPAGFLLGMIYGLVAEGIKQRRRS